MPRVPAGPCPSSALNLAEADVNRSGKVGVEDALLIAQCAQDTSACDFERE